MNYIELNKRILVTFKRKLNGEGKMKKVNDEAVPGLEYSLLVLTAVSKYYELIDDDENRRAKNAYYKTAKLLRDKIKGSKKLKPLDDERVSGIMYSLTIMNNQRLFLCKSNQQSVEKK